MTRPTYECCDLDGWRVEMHRKDFSFILIADCVHEIDDTEHRDESSEKEFALIEEISRNILVTALLDVENFQ